MNYYKVSIKVPVGKRLSELLAEGMRCDDEAHKLADSLHAVSYFPSPEADFGGIDVVEFKGEQQPNAKLWELIMNEEGLCSYIPNVQIKSEYLPVDQAETLRRSYGKIVSEQEIMITGKGKCKAVISISGNRKAVQLYKRIQALPIIPAGTASHILGINDGDTRPGMLELGEHIYIQTKHLASADGLDPISEGEFKNAVEEIEKTEIE